MRWEYLLTLYESLPIVNSLCETTIIEVGNELEYNEKCDVYSFAVLLWEILALKTPYELYTISSLRNRVWNGEQKRPFLNPEWPESLKTLLKRSWNKSIIVRPGFQEITEALRKQCVESRGGNEEGLEHSRRRSTFVFGNVKLDLSQLGLESSRFSFKK